MAFVLKFNLPSPDEPDGHMKDECPGNGNRYGNVQWVW